jgi:hypothetical protein
MPETASTLSTKATVAAIAAKAGASTRFGPTTRGYTLVKLHRARRRYLDLFHAAGELYDAPAAAQWDLELMRTDRAIAHVEDAIMALPVCRLSDIIDRALIARNRGLERDFVAGLVACFAG